MGWSVKIQQSIPIRSHFIMKSQIIIFLALIMLSACSSITKSGITQQPTLADYQVGEKWVWKYKGVTTEGEVRSDGKDTREIVIADGVLGMTIGKDTVPVTDIVKKDESKKPYEKAIDFSEVLGAKMHLLMVNTPNKFITSAKANKRMKKFAEHFKFSKYTTNIYNDLSIEKGIMNFSQSIDADLIGMSTHGRQGISHFFNGSISEDLVNHAKRPVITFKI